MAELHAGLMPYHVRWPEPPHYGRMPRLGDTPEDMCDEQNGEARCGRHPGHVGGCQDVERGWWVRDG